MYIKEIANSLKPGNGATEIKEKRTRRAKIFQTAPKKFRITASAATLHYPDSATGQLEEIDNRWERRGQNFVIDRAGYNLRVPADEIRYRFEVGSDISRRTLTHVGDSADLRIVPEIRNNNELWWPRVRPGVDIFLQARGSQVEFYKVIHAADAPRRFRWAIDRPERPTRVGVAAYHGAQDNYLRDHPDRPKMRREVATFATFQNRRIISGRERMEEVEGIDPRSALRNRSTRRLQWEDGESLLHYPIILDQADIDVDITDTNDDGFEETYGTHSFVESSGTAVLDMGCKDAPNYYYHGGLRFPSIPTVDYGDTIDDAYLFIQVTSHAITGSPTFDIQANAADDAAAWADNAANLPSTQSVTTAKGAGGAWAPTVNSYNKIDVTDVVKEIVEDRAGWGPGQAMRFGFKSLQTSGTHYFKWKDYSTSGYGTVASLEINFTAGAGGGGAKPRSLLSLGVGS